MGLYSKFISLYSKWDDNYMSDDDWYMLYIFKSEIQKHL